MMTSTHTATIRRQIKADRSRVFDAFTKPDALAKWFSPNPSISVEVLEFNFTAGGAYRICYHMPDGSKKGVGGTYDVIAPPNELSFTWIWEEPDPHAGLKTHVRVQFVEKGPLTEVILTHSKLPSEDVAAHHRQGWEGILDGLQRVMVEESADA